MTNGEVSISNVTIFYQANINKIIKKLFFTQLCRPLFPRSLFYFVHFRTCVKLIIDMCLFFPFLRRTLTLQDSFLIKTSKENSETTREYDITINIDFFFIFYFFFGFYLPSWKKYVLDNKRKVKTLIFIITILLRKTKFFLFII